MYASPARSTLLSGALHAAAIALILFTTGVKTSLVKTTEHTTLITPLDLLKYEVTVPQRDDAGGGGGMRAKTAASIGNLPTRALKQFLAPMVKSENPNPILTIVGSIVRIGLGFSDFTIGARNCLSARVGRLPMLAAVLARIPPPPPASSRWGTVTSYFRRSSGVISVVCSVSFTNEVLTPVVNRIRAIAAACSAPDNSVDRAGDAYMPPYDAARPQISNPLKIHDPYTQQ